MIPATKNQRQRIAINILMFCWVILAFALYYGSVFPAITQFLRRSP